MHIPPDRNARVELGHGVDRNESDDTSKRPAARATAPPAAISARAAQPSGPDRRSSAIEPDPWLAYSAHSLTGPVPRDQTSERRPKCAKLAGDRPTTWR